ncbi:G-type lectin S-receptor-like serine/threonine-protein kinase SD2-5 [Cajanus cajan]|uniref:G-type lectin S-receptor-like serine/threonine-protein kinase SD2-5 n=1 Tax=Cajanus cajan TaxID=3821 RepID=UPI0010FAE62E|nr:G-type lectin S-receptor-like serine/threonine-protein kinase SD2-5 [Cajanus cajan]
MGKQWSLSSVMNTLFLCFFFSSELVMTSFLKVGKVSPVLEGSQMNWIDRKGIFLVSNKGEFGFGFVTTPNDATLFLLAIVHMDSTKVVWVANRALPVSNSDKFVFDEKGNVLLQKGSSVVWSTRTSGKGVSSMELKDTGNLVLLGSDNRVIWQSFSHPTDTLLPMQDFIEGMKLVSEPGSNNLTYVLEIQSGNVILSTGLQSPQPYWSMQKDSRRIINKNGDLVASATLNANSWRFYDETRSLLWQFVFAKEADANATWIAVLGSDGLITFSNLLSGGSIASATRIPQDSCSTPEPCGPYNICSGEKKCTCPSVLSSRPNCKPGFVSPCNSKRTIELLKGDDGLNYFALEFLQPSSKTDLIGCKTYCSANCSCVAMFFHNSSGNCFLLDRIGSFEKSDEDSGFVSYVKVVSSDEHSEESGSSNMQTIIVVIIVILTLIVISGMLFVARSCFRKKQDLPESPQEDSEDYNFLGSLTGMPIRYSYSDLETATSNFSVKLGQGGFGSVYKGVLPDGTQLAVKKLEGISQGKKEFRVEVSIIGSIHHNHLVRLKGFCAEGSHRLLAYEYMANGSLDKWIFKKHKEEFVLDWDARYNIALGTAKGLAYLHQDCDSKIIHCDIKPENVLLDDNFLVKVSDFGLAKLMTREQSHVFTTLRGTRGYLAPEWITNCAISEKSDVYSYGMVLLEIIGGRKNYDSSETSEKTHFPSFAFKMMEEGKVREILDSKVETCENDERVHTALQVALWCIQEDMSLRPSMTKVVQMLEGLCTVPKPPSCSVLGSRFYSTSLKSMSENGTSSGPSDCNSDAYLSAVRLSGPR